MWFQRTNGDERSVGAGSGENQRRFQDSQSRSTSAFSRPLRCTPITFHLWPERRSDGLAYCAEDGVQEAEVMGGFVTCLLEKAVARRSLNKDCASNLESEVFTLEQDMRKSEYVR